MEYGYSLENGCIDIKIENKNGKVNIEINCPQNIKVEVK